MFLKWKDFSGASHIIEGIEEAVGYPALLHFEQAREVAEAYDGPDVTIRRLTYPDIWHQSLADAETDGHSLNQDAKQFGYATSVIPWDTDPDGGASPGSRAVWVEDTVRSGEVLRVDIPARSFGAYIVATMHGRGAGRRRDHLFIDTPGPVYLMSDTGQTIDRFTVDAAPSTHGPVR